MSTIYTDCAATLDDQRNLLQCLSTHFDDAREKRDASNQDVKHWLVLLAGSQVFFMQAGFALICAGSVRKKNVFNTIMKNFMDCCTAAVVFYMVGFGVAFGDQPSDNGWTFVGSTNYFTTGRKEYVDFAFWFYQFAVASTTVTIIAGTLAERCKMSAYLGYAVMMVGWVYPIVAHAFWSDNGLLSPTNVSAPGGIRVIDVAGSGVVHLTAGTVALVSVLILGPRIGRFYDSAGNMLPHVAKFAGYSLAMQLLGTFILWFGWIGFNAGSTLILSKAVHVGQQSTLAAANTVLAGATAGLTALMGNYTAKLCRNRITSFSLLKTMNGVTAGLVAITAGCAVVDLWVSLVIGAISGLLYLVGSDILIWNRIDDAVDGIPIHMFNGLWGMISVGIFAKPEYVKDVLGLEETGGLVYGGSASLLLNQIIGALCIMAWSTAIMYPVMIGLHRAGLLRPGNLEEVVGLDTRYHGGGNNDEALGEIQQDIKTFRASFRIQKEAIDAATEVSSRRP